MTQKQRNDRYNLTINRGLFDKKKIDVGPSIMG